MIYKNIFPAVFIYRINRFTAEIEINGAREICHVKNTGRCRELLIEGALVYVQLSDSLMRKTKYDLVAVMKGNRLVNIDSQAPNKVFGEWIKEGNFEKTITLIKPECRYENSRFDFYIEAGERKIFVEVKGVTLEENETALFPDAPTERGVKHVNELCKCMGEGYEAYIFFVIQMENVRRFEPNRRTHKEFADALNRAVKNKVKVRAVNCLVTPNELKIKEYVKVKLIE